MPRTKPVQIKPEVKTSIGWEDIARFREAWPRVRIISTVATRTGLLGPSLTMVALHPTLVYAATHVQVALLAATLTTATLAWAYRSGRTGRGSRAPAPSTRASI